MTHHTPTSQKYDLFCSISQKSILFMFGLRVVSSKKYTDQQWVIKTMDDENSVKNLCNRITR